jgi:hypothetical protein
MVSVGSSREESLDRRFAELHSGARHCCADSSHRALLKVDKLRVPANTVLCCPLQPTNPNEDSTTLLYEGSILDLSKNLS